MLSIFILSISKQNAFILTVILNVVMQSGVTILSAFTINVVMLSVITMIGIMLGVVVLNVDMLSRVILNAIMLDVATWLR